MKPVDGITVPCPCCGKLVAKNNDLQKDGRAWCWDCFHGLCNHPKIEKPKVDLCIHCGGDIRIRNPMGDCDHLYYPENCPVCKRIDVAVRKSFAEGRRATPARTEQEIREHLADNVTKHYPKGEYWEGAKDGLKGALKWVLGES